ncbi:von Willebrand factor type A domain-containing protein [Micromonospora nigra]|uniref:von Willebrand factor type A domain-containing protein n=1 Tax=Micromonospora nigra TaxID=145857 RepID=A0A1C6RWB6_9ACTN|nr:substrate-binding and VWA domain-containing protein [Micromonospora nigra]SCL21465.1 von Willebrand factor type A domain-containing protein [Micromonospora nigra]
MLRNALTSSRDILRRSPVVLLSAALAVLLLGWATVTYVASERRVPACSDQIRLRLAAAPVVAPALDRIARASVGSQPCVSVVVEARQSGEMVRDLADGVDVADAWLPESTFWLRRARSAGAFEVPAQGTSVASTPVVLAVTEPSARRWGWPRRALTWRTLVGRATKVSVRLPDPAVDPAGVATLVGVRALVAGEREPDGALTATLRRLAGRTFTPPEEGSALVSGRQLPGRAEAVATTEQAVLEHNTLADSAKLVGAYPEVAVPALDLPYAVLPNARDAVRDAANRLLAELLTARARDTLADAGFRSPAGFPPAIPRDDRLSTEELRPTPLPAEEAVTDLLTGWSGVQRSARILTVLDISGSMAAKVPGGESRLDATLQAAREGSALLLDNSELGVWVFSTRVDGDRDHREILPVAPLGDAHRQRLADRLAEVRVKPRGGTGLYDTTLAAYRDARRNWTPGRINLVLVMTDGRDEDGDSIGRTKFLAELTKLQDPRRPLPVVFIGLGRDVDPDELNAVAKVTGGQVFRTDEPSGIRQIFFSALADLSCLPPECRR